MNFVTSWSGGKDSCYAMMKAIEQGLRPKVLLNMMNENGKVSRSHGLPLSILEQQAQKMIKDFTDFFNLHETATELSQILGLALTHPDVTSLPTNAFSDLAFMVRRLQIMINGVYMIHQDLPRIREEIRQSSGGRPK